MSNLQQNPVMTSSPHSFHRPSVPVLFLSGAGLPAWIWDHVRGELADVAITDVARYPRGGDMSLAHYADALAAQVPWPRLAVVAHSIGGVVAAELVARHPRRVAGILAVAAVIPRPGHSFIRSMPLPNRLVLGTVLRVAGTRPPATVLRSGLAAGVSEAIGDRIITDFDPESVGLYRDASSARTMPGPRAYLYTSEDKEVPPATQRRSAENLGAAWTTQVSTGHLPMLQDPAAVSRAVRRLMATIEADADAAQ